MSSNDVETNKKGFFSQSFVEPLGHISHLIVHLMVKIPVEITLAALRESSYLARRSSDDKIADGIPGQLDVREGAQQMDLLVRNHNAGTGGVLDGVFRLKVCCEYDKMIENDI